MSTPLPEIIQMPPLNEALPGKPTAPTSYCSQGAGRGSLGGRLLIHCAITLTASASTRFFASGGIFVPSTALFIRSHAIDWLGLLGVISCAPWTPKVLITGPLMKF